MIGGNSTWSGNEWTHLVLITTLILTVHTPVKIRCKISHMLKQMKW